MILDLLQDAFFAALAAIGFSAISNPPRKALLYCALIAAVGHSLRYFMIHTLDWNIIPSTTIASAAIGVLAVIFSSRPRIPAETYLYPSLLPMIPGIYAYKAFGALVMCLYRQGETDFQHYFYLFADNGLMCFFILLGMVVGATLPMFLLPHVSFTATRQK